MGRIVVSEFLSLDAVYESPGGEGDFKHRGWTDGFSSGEAGTAFKYQELMDAEAQLLGRIAYEGFAAAWPHMEAETGDFGKKMNEMPKYVVSSTLENPAWKNTTVLNGRPAEEIRRLREQIDGTILVAGSGQLVHLMLEQDLVDELRLMIHPIVVGSGKRLFGESEEPTRLRQARVEAMGDVNLLVFDRYSQAQ